MQANKIVNDSLYEFRDIIGSRSYTLKQKTLAFKGLMHVCLPHLTDVDQHTKTRLTATIYEWNIIRKPCEPDYPLWAFGCFLQDFGNKVLAG